MGSNIKFIELLELHAFGPRAATQRRVRFGWIVTLRGAALRRQSPLASSAGAAADDAPAFARAGSHLRALVEGAVERARLPRLIAALRRRQPSNTISLWSMPCERLANARGASVPAMAVAQGRDIVPPVGARKRGQWAESAAADGLRLTEADLKAIQQAVPRGAAKGDRYPDQAMAHLDSQRRE